VLALDLPQLAVRRKELLLDGLQLQPLEPRHDALGRRRRRRFAGRRRTRWRRRRLTARWGADGRRGDGDVVRRGRVGFGAYGLDGIRDRARRLRSRADHGGYRTADPEGSDLADDVPRWRGLLRTGALRRRGGDEL